MTGRRGAKRVDSDSVGSSADVAVDTGRIRAVLALGGVPLDALDDGIQQVRLKLLEEQANPAAAEIRNQSAWVAVVASRVAADWHRARKKDVGLRDRLAARWLRRPPTDHPEEDRLLALTVAEGLEGLPTAQRQVLALRFYADLTVRDIALQLDIPEGTVKSRLHAAISAMRTRLNEMEVI
ncbi:sigma-70 family RNA polymerase sigma factor [Streptomyces sp. VNUA24]|uniref:RNA polymerase sigma factor n=1 Tax=Streptomyces sp. VNUA24 TaxID=3031131 RepID=UPI0023B87003|nr:sigma-70 family RNA polymerase sigma factor [Streptomyces sp. VNUA24]WEH16343.1 sigma-70 family RNA polymerase sigma factor [Streptomyces sp. VNUA24]